MKNRILHISFTITVVLLSNASSQIMHDSNILFEYDHAFGNVSQIEHYIIERTYISINHDLIASGRLKSDSSVSFQLHGIMQDFSILRAHSYIDGTHSIIARGGESGHDRLLLTFEGDRMVGSIIMEDIFEHYHIRYDGIINRTYIAKVNPSKLDLQDCSVDSPDYHALQPGSREPRTHSHHDHFSPNLSALASTLTDIITIDLMIVYTEAAEEWADGSGFGSINAVIAEAMNLSQDALDNSNVFIELRLVHVHKTDYDETQLNPQSGMTHLRRLTASKDHNPFGEEFEGYMEEVHELRDQYGADLVALFASEPGTGGTGWLLTVPLGSSGYGFSINRVQQIGNSYTLIHEIGHNLGNAHARDQASQPAGLVGGLFEYSTGYRWSGSTGNYTTVMGYTEGVFTSIPHFSNPYVSWDGDPTGTYLEQHGPSDNARSMRELKAVIAHYRTTMVDPPAISVSENSIEVFIDPENTYRIPVTIMNNGDSDLMWSIDFIPRTEDVAHGNEKIRRDAPYEIIEADDLYLEADGPMFHGAVFSVADLDNTEILSTSFSAEEGFQVGTYSATRFWRTWTDAMQFEISDENPSLGNKHLRISRQESINYGIRVESPFFGPQPFGAFEFSADISFENMVAGDEYERFQINIYDASFDIAASMYFANGYVYIRERASSGVISWFTSFEPYTIDGYGNVRILTDPDEGAIHYYYKGEYLRSTEYLTGKKFDYIYFTHNNRIPGTYIDIDNVRVKRLYDPFQWMSLDRYGGTALPGTSSEFTITLSSFDISPGEYSTDIVLRSNDPDSPEIILPVRLNISTVISVDELPAVPHEFSLLQNYPNPFNPGTVITFHLPESDRIRLEVYDIVGRRVAVLIDDEVVAGEHQIMYDVTGLSSGVYMYRLTSGIGTINRKMVITK